MDYINGNVMMFIYHIQQNHGRAYSTALQLFVVNKMDKNISFKIRIELAQKFIYRLEYLQWNMQVKS